jgi:hypothetical protein
MRSCKEIGKIVIIVVNRIVVVIITPISASRLLPNLYLLLTTLVSSQLSSVTPYKKCQARSSFAIDAAESLPNLAYRQRRAKQAEHLADFGSSRRPMNLVFQRNS